MSTATAFTAAGEISIKSWQRLSDHEQSGRYTYNLIPVVKSKLLLPVQRDIGIFCCRLLLRDSMLKDDSYRSGTSVSPMCDCGSEKATSEHFLLRCIMYAPFRDDMVDQLSQLRTQKNNAIQITESLLLAAESDDISKSCNRTKSSCFSFYPVPSEQYKLSLSICTKYLYSTGLSTIEVSTVQTLLQLSTQRWNLSQLRPY